MKKGVAVGFLLLSFLTSCGGAQKVQTNLSLKEAVYYQKGYEEGYKKGLEEGKSSVWEKVRRNLKLWEKDVLAFEVGKFALERGYLSQPVLYRTKKGAEVKGGVPLLSKMEELLKLSIPQLPFLNENEEVAKTETKEIPYPSSYPVWGKVPFLEGYRKGYEKGYEDGRKEAEREVREFEKSPVFLQTFLKLEREKYYLPSYLITYPRLYKVYEGSKVKVVVVPPRIEPLRKDLLSLKVPLPVQEEKRDYYGGITLPATSIPYYFSGKPVETIKVKVKCSLELQKWGIPYVKEGDYCVAFFPNEGVKEEFCKNTKSCRR